MENLVVNWHITEKCNYHCKFCFAKCKVGENAMKKAFSVFIQHKAFAIFLREIRVYIRAYKNFMIKFIGEF